MRNYHGKNSFYCVVWVVHSTQSLDAKPKEEYYASSAKNSWWVLRLKSNTLLKYPVS